MRILASSLLFLFHAGSTMGWRKTVFLSNTTFTFIGIASFCAIRFSYREPVRPGDWVGYLSKRISALYPTFWIVSLLLFAGSFLYPASTLGRPFQWSELALNFLGLSQYFDARYFSRTMWFVPFVMQIYLLIPLFRRWKAAPELALLECFGISLALCLLVFWRWPAQANEICRAWSPLFRLPVVYLGVALALCRTRAALCRILVLFAMLAILLRGAAEAWPMLASPFSRPLDGLVVAATVGAIAMPIAHALRNLPSLSSWITQLGKASYPFFLFHGTMMTFLWKKAGSSPAAWALYFVGCWVVAVLIQRLVDSLQRSAAGLFRRDKATKTPLTEQVAVATAAEE